MLVANKFGEGVIEPVVPLEVGIGANVATPTTGEGVEVHVTAGDKVVVAGGEGLPIAVDVKAGAAVTGVDVTATTVDCFPGVVGVRSTGTTIVGDAIVMAVGVPTTEIGCGVGVCAYATDAMAAIPAMIRPYPISAEVGHVATRQPLPAKRRCTKFNEKEGKAGRFDCSTPWRLSLASSLARAWSS